MTKRRKSAPHLSREVELGHLASDISYMTRALRAHIRMQNEAALADSGASSGQIAVLNLIQLNPGMSQNDLAAAVVVKKPAVTKLVSRLEDEGLIERVRQDGDRRFNALTLTPKGEAIMTDLRRRMKENTDRILSCLDPGEREIFLSMLGRVVDHLIELNGPVVKE